MVSFSAIPWVGQLSFHCCGLLSQTLHSQKSNLTHRLAVPSIGPQTAPFVTPAVGARQPAWLTSSLPSQPPAAGPVPPPARASNHSHSAEPGPAAPRSSPSQSTQRYLTHTHNRRHASTATWALAAYQAAEPKLAVYGHGVDSPDAQHEVLLLGDSMVRFVELPHTITYCFSGFKVADMIEHCYYRSASLCPHCNCSPSKTA